MKMKLLIGFCIITGVLSQGFIPPFRPVSPAIQRRQLTPVQQSHILSDIQQHQHRFNVHQTQGGFSGSNNFNGGRAAQFGQQQQSPLIAQPTQNSFVNQRLAPPANQFNPVAFPQPANNGRQQPFAQPSVRQVQGFGTSGSPTQQHHTQTNFIPNFSQTQQQSRAPHQQRSVQNQLGQPPQFFNSNNQFQQDVFPPHTRPFASPLVQQAPPQLPQAQFLPNIPAPQQQLPSHVRFPTTAFGQGPQNQFGQGPQNQVIQIQPSLGAEVGSVQQINPFLLSQQPQQPFVQSQPQQSFVQPQFNNFQQNNQFSQPIPQFPQQQQQQFPQQSRQLTKEEVEKQKIIQKHEQFVQKHQQKQQAKVQQLHQEFIKKQQKIQQSKVQTTQDFPTQSQINAMLRSRGILPSEETLFENALKAYDVAHPTTTVAPSTTTAAPTSAPSSVIPLRSRNKNDVSVLTQGDLEALLNGQKPKLFSQVRQDDKSKSKSKVKSTKALGRDELLRQLKLALAENPQDLGGKNFSSMDLVLPNGEKVQVIRTTDPNLVKGATKLNAETPLSQQLFADSAPKAISLDDLTKGGILPPGADFEVIKQTADGAQEVVKLPAQKKVTFVYLEEQDDGSYKVQGVKGNGDKAPKTTGAEVDSILGKIKNGEIQLPPPSNKAARQTQESSASGSTTKVVNPSSVTVIPLSTPYVSANSNSISRSSPTPQPSAQTSSRIVNSPTAYSTAPTYKSDNTVFFAGSTTTYFPTTTPQPSADTSGPLSSAATSTNTVFAPVPTAATSESANANELLNTLKTSGLYAMAKYLKQSGLDSILNETGPYTIFAPTDKAFKSLLVQLGGPEKAEEKFKNNPRLLSGLLLHHVIPGAFEISALQDEMTGVSLAGTQLRVNQYNMQDAEWNDVKVTTINGGMVVPDKQDIIVPQGVAHAVDRVMFPLPVGDILQTLQSDRERRFTNFLRALFTSEVSETLQNKGSKTYTVFAPVDAAFANLSPEELNKIVTDKTAAEAFVTKHIVPGTLFTAGMRFYQVKDSMSGGKSVTVQKTAGKIKVNEGLILTSNIPTTNGVIHAIDSLL